MPSDAVICACIQAATAILLKSEAAAKAQPGELAEHVSVILDALLATVPTSSSPDHHADAAQAPRPAPAPKPEVANCPEVAYKLSRGVFENFNMAQIWLMDTPEAVKAAGIKKYSQSGRDYIRWMASSDNPYGPWRTKARAFLQAQGEELPE